MLYPAAIHKEPDSCYGVSFPDLPGCISAGDDLDEAVANAREALDLHLWGIAEDGEPIPQPRPIEAWADDPDWGDVFLWVMIPADQPEASQAPA